MQGNDYSQYLQLCAAGLHFEPLIHWIPYVLRFHPASRSDAAGKLPSYLPTFTCSVHIEIMIMI
jgi:hypothetical protein